jgi:hypothetical protein
MTDQQKLEEAAKVAYEAEGFSHWEYVSGPVKNRYMRSATAMRTFWASHAEPEMGLAGALRMVSDYLMGAAPVPVSAWGGNSTPAWSVYALRKEADRLDADSQQRDRDITVGKAIRKRFYVEDTKAKPFDDIDLTLGRAAREAVGAEK